METKTVAKGDKFIWNDAVKVEVIRTYKTNNFCNVKCSTLLTSWTKKQPLPLSESFVPVDSFEEFDSDEEYWGEGGPTKDATDVSQFSDIEVAEKFFLAAWGDTITSQDELNELTMNWEFIQGAEEEDELPLEVIGGAVTSGSSASDGSETVQHLHEQGIRGEEDSGLPSNVKDAT